MAARRRTRDSRGDADGVAPVTRVRMTGKERRQQLLDVARELFAEKGFDGTSIEEIAHRAGVGHPRELLEKAARALLDYIEGSSDGFRIMVRDSPVASASGTFSSLLNDIASQVEHILGLHFDARGYDPKLAGLYAQALVGMVALTGQWWLEVRKPKKDEVAAHLVNLAWNGLSHLEGKPKLRTR